MQDGCCQSWVCHWLGIQCHLSVNPTPSATNEHQRKSINPCANEICLQNWQISTSHGCVLNAFSQTETKCNCRLHASPVGHFAVWCQLVKTHPFPQHTSVCSLLSSSSFRTIQNNFMRLLVQNAAAVSSGAIQTDKNITKETFHILQACHSHGQVQQQIDNECCRLRLFSERQFKWLPCSGDVLIRVRKGLNGKLPQLVVFH